MYTPINVNVFVAAYSGAMAGQGVSGRIPTDQNTSDYNGLALVVGAYAEAFDIQWAARATSTLDLDMIEAMSEGAWEGRNASTTDPNSFLHVTYYPEILAMIAQITAAEKYFTDNGIIVPSGGVSPAPGALTAQDWYLDPLNSTGLAKSTNNGTTPTTPLLTMAQVLSKFGLGNVINTTSDLVTFHYLSVPTDPDDRFDLSGYNVSISKEMSVRVEAPASTLVRNSTLTAVTPIDRAYGTAAPMIIDDGGGAFVKGQRITITSGPSIGARAFVTQTKAGPVEITPFNFPYSIAGASITPTIPAPGATFRVETLPALPVADILTHSEGGSVLNKAFLFSNFSINPGARLSLRSNISSLPMVLDGCTVATIIESSGELTLTNSFTNSGANLSFNGQTVNVVAGFYGDFTVARAGTTLIMSQDCIIGAPLSGLGFGTAIQFANVGFFNITGDAFTVGDGATVQVGAGGQFFGAGTAYGRTISGFGARILSGGQLIYNSTNLPATQGDLGDWRMQTGTPYFLDEATIPGTGIWTQATAGTPNTWANLNNAQPGGFGTGNAHDPDFNCHILNF